MAATGELHEHAYSGSEMVSGHWGSSGSHDGGVSAGERAGESVAAAAGGRVGRARQVSGDRAGLQRVSHAIQEWRAGYDADAVRSSGGGRGEQAGDADAARMDGDQPDEYGMD